MNQGHDNASKGRPMADHVLPPGVRAPVVVAIDDDTAFLLATAKALASAGMVCHTATTGEAGFRLIRDYAPDLVLLDILLIGESGFTLCQEIRRTWSPEELPVIMVTGLEDLESIKTAYESGANDFLAKPLHWKHLPFRIRHILQASRDITERKRTEFALRQANLVLENSPAVVFRWKVTTGWPVEMVSQNVNQFGYTAEDLVSGTVPFAQMVHPEDLDRVDRETHENIARGADGFRLEYRLITKNGGVRWVDDRTRVERDTNGEIIFYQGVILDITERKQAEEKLRWNASFLNLMANSSPLAFLVVDNRTDQILYFNHRFCELWGITHLEQRMALGELNNNQIIPACLPMLIDVSAFTESCKPLQSEGNRITVEDYIPFTNGRTIRRYSTQMRGADDEYFGRFYLFEDVTEQKQLEEKLKSSETNFRTFFDTMTDLIMVGTPEGRLIYSNAAVTQFLGYSAEELATMHILDVHPADKRQEAEAIFAAMFRGERDNCPLPLAAKSGALIPVETRAWFGQWSGEDCIFGISKNLTAEQDAQQRFERLFRHNPMLMALSSLPERRFSDVNDAFLETLGYSRNDVIGRTAAELGLFPHPEQQAALADKLQTEGRIADFELKIQRKNGDFLDGIFSGEVISSQGRQCFLTVMINITERKQIEEALRKSEERYRSILNASPDDITIADLEGRILMISPAALTMFGYEREEELLGHMVTEFIAPEDRDRASSNVAIMFQGVIPGPAEYRGLRYDGSTLDLEVNREFTRDAEGQPTSLVFVVRDITQRKQAEEERRNLEERMGQVQKLEALGVLVGGVAHNINNVLMVIMGAASLREGHTKETKDLEAYTLIGKACRRGRDVVKSLIQFAQPSVSNQIPCDLHALIKGLRNLLESTTGNRITIIEAFIGESLWVHGDAGSISNALMNLCLNSLDAMPNGGNLTFRTAAQEKDWVEVSVEDTGEGMTPEVLARVVEPFFTTKEVGKGTGLGLSMTHGVIKAHGGTLEISSVVGQGTTVKLRFPRIPAPAQEETVELASLTPRALNVLLVDDDEDVRFLVARILKHAGLQINCVASGEAALESLGSDSLPDLIILDQNMPRMNGIQTMEKIRALRVEVPIFISSGQPDIEEWPCFEQPNVTVISKPFKVEEVLANLAKMSLKSKIS